MSSVFKGKNNQNLHVTDTVSNSIELLFETVRQLLCSVNLVTGSKREISSHLIFVQDWTK